MASFEADIRPLFREDDRQAMRYAFDLWDYDDVADHAEDILERLEDGTMPCDAPWDESKIDLFREWLDGDMEP